MKMSLLFRQGPFQLTFKLDNIIESIFKLLNKIRESIDN